MLPRIQINHQMNNNRVCVRVNVFMQLCEHSVCVSDIQKVKNRNIVSEMKERQIYTGTFFKQRIRRKIFIEVLIQF